MHTKTLPASRAAMDFKPHMTDTPLLDAMNPLMRTHDFDALRASARQHGG